MNIEIQTIANEAINKLFKIDLIYMYEFFFFCSLLMN